MLTPATIDQIVNYWSGLGFTVRVEPNGDIFKRTAIGNFNYSRNVKDYAVDPITLSVFYR